MAEENAISPTREEDYPEWYQQVVKAADLAETSPVRGCMVIKPWGYGIWENIQRTLDAKIKATGHENLYFPLFIPISFLEKEAAHVEGFAKECAVVTHHRLEEREGKLVPTAELEEPLIVRPTSETIIGDSFSKWIKSYRDLPLLINQWANVVRWEMRTRLFLRTAEFLWQEGHTAHASEEDARREVDVAVEMYRQLVEEALAIPVIIGEKSAGERFPGAVTTVALEAMMQDRKALQAGTSHYLGQNFARAQNIQFLNDRGELEYAHTTSWGVSTRLIGAVIMAHGDDDGIRIPPRIAPKHAVILPVLPKPEAQAEVFAYADRIAAELSGQPYGDSSMAVQVDKREMRGGEKNWHWIKKGVPLRVEVGPRDIKNDAVVVYRRDQGAREKIFLSRSDFIEKAARMLDEIQDSYFAQAKAYQQQHTADSIRTYDEFREFFTPKNQAKQEIHGGFVAAKWCGDEEASRGLLEPLKATIRCLPRAQSGTPGKCVLTGRDAVLDAIFAKAY